MPAPLAGSAKIMTRTEGPVIKDEVFAIDRAETSGRAKVQIAIRDLAESSGAPGPHYSGGLHFEDVIIILCVRWYLRYSLSYRDLEEMMAERGLSVDHVTVWRWVQHYAPILNQRLRRELHNRVLVKYIFALICNRSVSEFHHRPDTAKTPADRNQDAARRFAGGASPPDCTSSMVN